MDKPYDSFCDSFDAYVRRKKRNRNYSRRGQVLPRDVSEWTPAQRGEPFTEQEEVWRKMATAVTDYIRVQYAGHTFRTAASEVHIKTCNSILRIDYVEHDGATRAAYGSIKRLFEHHMFPGGPSRLVAECDWYFDEGIDEVSGLPIVSVKPDSNFNRKSRFTFFESVYARPVAVWPYDPFAEFDSSVAHRNHYLVIDRNEPEV